MNKVILVFYLNVEGVNNEDVPNLIENFKRESQSDDLIQYFIPIREGESRVECVYPKYVVDEQVSEEFKSVINRLDSYVKKISLN